MITSDLRNLVLELKIELEESTNLFSSSLIPTDKFYNHCYDLAYEHIFSKIRHNDMNVLEIGVLHGFSMLIWERYFTNSKIVGMDIDMKIPCLWGPDTVKPNPLHERLFLKDNRLNLCQADSSTPGVVSAALDAFKMTGFDIIIDDGSHAIKDQIATLLYSYDSLADGGCYLIEDAGEPEHPDLDHLDIFMKIKGMTIFDMRPYVYNFDKDWKKHDDVILVFIKEENNDNFKEFKKEAEKILLNPLT